MQHKPYRDFNSYLRQAFGCRVQKISLDAGLTCPNRDGTVGRGGCIYCNPRGSGTGASSSGRSLTEQVQAAQFFLRKRYKASKFLGYFQSFTNTHAPLSTLLAMYEEVLALPDMVGLTIGTRPDCVPDPTLDGVAGLADKGLIWMEYGLQSAHDATLELINRGHRVEDFVSAVDRTRQRKLPVCAHVILGLPGESHDQMMDTARFLAGLGVEAVKLHLLYVIQGTRLQAMHQAGDYTCLTRDEYARLVGDFLSLLPPEMIIQRLTGDPHPEELVAPEWALEKQTNLQAIHASMARRQLWQGKYFSSRDFNQAWPP